MRGLLPLLLALVPVLGSARPAAAAVKSELVTYKQGKQELEGYLAYDDAVAGKRPAVLVVHNWMGVGDSARASADKLAAAGFVAFAVDIYGKGVRPTTPAEAGKLAGTYKGDRKLFRARLKAGYDVVARHDRVDSKKIAVIGYCFGGTGALELARSGAPVRGAVSFHGGLDSPTPADAKHIKAKVLVLHGAEDPHVPPAEVDAFMKEMRDAKVDWQLVYYSGAVHAFTEPGAGNDPSKGAAYDARADKRSWAALMDFLAEVFA
jgi:dienelactone hydrolase